MTTTASPSTKRAQPKGSVRVEILCVLLFIGLALIVVVPSMIKKNVNQNLIDAKAMLLKLFKIAQSSAVIEHGPLDIKQKVRLLMHGDPNYQGYCNSMMIIQGERGHWRVLQPPMEFPPGVFFIVPSEAFLYTMSFDVQNLADGQGPTWIYYEFDSKGKYIGTLNRVCIREGELEEKDGKLHVAYTPYKEASCIYVNPNGTSYDVKR